MGKKQKTTNNYQRTSPNKPYHNLLLIITFTLILFFLSCGTKKIEILSCILRDRVVLLDKLGMKKALFVAFQFDKNSEGLNGIEINGTVSCKKKKISEYSVNDFKGKYGNLIFDLPYDIPEEKYNIEINVLSDKGQLYSKNSVTLHRSELKSYFGEKKVKAHFEELFKPSEEDRFIPSEMDKKRGYILFSRPPLEYVFPGALPEKEEIVDSITLMMARNEFEPLTFSLYPLGDLGWVTVSASDLIGSEGTISNRYIKIARVEEVESTIGLPKGKYQKLPTLLRPRNSVESRKGRCARFWLTVRTKSEVKPGIYEGNIYINPQFGEKRSLPLKVKVTPITLTDIPDIDYFMLMTYEFVELTMPWDESDKKRIYNSALNVLRDYKDHGMTTICLHSPFVQIEQNDGFTNLDDIFAALHATKEIEFTRPIICYLGHLIQTAKSRHPGNIISFDEKLHIDRLKKIVKRLAAFSKENNCPEVIFLPIDEPDDAYSDPSGKRQKITPLLLKTIHEMNAKTMVTSRKKYEDVDYICSGKFSKKTLLEAHKNGKVYWVYDNIVTVKANNPAYARYKYGYDAWKKGIDGMSSWTFQITQNAQGLPEVADTAGNDVYLAYPHPDGPMATLKWEAIREGIDDHKLIYQLEKRINTLRKIGEDSKVYEEYLLGLRQKQGEPGISSGDFKGWTPDFFEKNREKIMDLILNADRKIAYKKALEIN